MTAPSGSEGTTDRWSERYAALVVRRRWWVIAGWLLILLFCLLRPPLAEPSADDAANIIPLDSPALLAEQRSFEHFGFPLSSRTTVVQRDPGGLSPYVEGESVLDAIGVDQHEQDYPLLGALPLPNAVRITPTQAEQDTTILTYLFMDPLSSFSSQSSAAHRYIGEHLDRADDHVVGVTGSVPARNQQASLLSENLHTLEIATLLAIFLLVGLAFRSLVVPLVALVASGVAVVVTTWVLPTFAALLGISPPGELKPLLVALLLGVVTDYTVFYITGLDRLTGRGMEAHAAVRQTVRSNTHVIMAAGFTVALGTMALLVAHTAFFHSFGPAMAMTVMIGLVVSISLVPAVLSVLGHRVFWPRRGRRVASVGPAGGGAGTRRLIALLVRRRIAAAALGLSTVALLLAAVPLLNIQLSAAFTTSLPTDNPVRVAARAAAAGFAPGVTSPTTLLLEGPGLDHDPAQLLALQHRIGREPGVAMVIGPAQMPPGLPVNVMVSKDGTAARMLVVFDHDPLDATAIADLSRLRERLPALSQASGLGAARVSLAGDTALAAGLVRTTSADLGRIAVASLLANLVILVIFLRALVAPLYLLASSILALGAALGLTTWFFTTFLGHDGITFYVPFAASVLLVSLGSDYNIFGVGTVWERARTMPLTAAIETAVPETSRAITTAGLALAVSFGMLAVIPLGSFAELGFAMAVGILIDAFVVRSLMVPALLILVGPASSWPGRLRPSVPPAENSARLASAG